jgi:hypothetical protein
MRHVKAETSELNIIVLVLIVVTVIIILALVAGVLDFK